MRRCEHAVRRLEMRGQCQGPQKTLDVSDSSLLDCDSGLSVLVLLQPVPGKVRLDVERNGNWNTNQNPNRKQESIVPGLFPNIHMKRDLSRALVS